MAQPTEPRGRAASGVVFQWQDGPPCPMQFTMITEFSVHRSLVPPEAMGL